MDAHEQAVWLVYNEALESGDKESIAAIEFIIMRDFTAEHTIWQYCMSQASARMSDAEFMVALDNILSDLVDRAGGKPASGEGEGG